MDAQTETRGSSEAKGPSPVTAADLVDKGDQARDLKDWEQARASYEEALRLDPTWAPIWIQLGHACKESGDYLGAEDAYRKALELNPDDADGHLQLGHLMKVVGRLSDASDFYGHAISLDPLLADAHKEIDSLKRKVSSEGEGGVQASSRMKRKIVPAGTLAVIFEVSDLTAYFRGSRLPTGIQRVQMEVIKALSETELAGIDYSIACFVQDRGFWVEIPQRLFDRFCQASVAGGDVDAADWQMLLASLDRVLSGDPLFRFPDEAILLDLGTSWWQRNYFLNLRVAKSTCKIRYVPFVHDLIPVMTPEYCAADLRRDFLSWIAGVFHHADHFFVNSQSTKADLTTVAGEVGQVLSDTAVVPLGADFRRSVDSLELALEDEREHFLETHDLRKGSYVLCVATIEARKNHAAAFAVWLRLIKKYGSRNVPKLVCVGKDGWLNDNIYNMLGASEILTHHVLMLQNVSDVALAALYENCLCTVYPSFYEGWGLPVTEALCYGKVPVVARASSLPEAGGDFAEYFEIGSENDLLGKVERLIRDDKYRGAREAKIAKEFRPRAWQQISAQIVTQLKQWAEKERTNPTTLAGVKPARAALGILHSLARDTDFILWKGLQSGEVYRNGRAWWSLEDWGCWTIGKHIATLTFSLEDIANNDILVYLALRGTPAQESICSLKSEGVHSLEVELKAGQDQVVVLEVPACADAKRDITISIGSETAVNLGDLTEGTDRRVVGPGVRWFYVCKRDDLLARVGMAEALAMGDFRRLMRRPPVHPDFFIHS